MKKFIFIFFFFTGCHSSVYLVVGDESFSTEQDKRRLKKLILLSDKHFQNSAQLIEILNKQRWNDLAHLQTQTDRNGSDFLQAVQLMIESKYDVSYQLLKNIPDSTFDCEIQILKADCVHDMHAGSIDSLYRQYQQAADCSREAKIKELAKKRYQFIKYGY